MKVKEVIEYLSTLNQEAEVILQKDAEGNGYSHLCGIDPDGIYVEEDGFNDATVYSTSWSADEAGMTDKEWSKFLKKPKCVVFFPY